MEARGAARREAAGAREQGPRLAQERAHAVVELLRDAEAARPRVVDDRAERPRPRLERVDVLRGDVAGVAEHEEGREREERVVERVEPRARVEAPRGDRVERAPAWKSTGEPERPDQTLKCSRSVTSTAIRLILGRIDGAHRVLEARRKCVCHIVRRRSH